MVDERKAKKTEAQVENLELNRETLQDLTESQAVWAGGGAVQNSAACDGVRCTAKENGCV